MTTANNARRAHDILDWLATESDLSREKEQLLRSFLPERPKQKTLDEICALVEKFYDDASTGQGYLPVGGAKILPQIAELHEQLKGLIESKPASPALPAGMRLAEHEEYGRVVVSPKPNNIGEYKIFRLDNNFVSGSGFDHAKPDELTPIDAEPTEPTHPEFLETAADYEKAPEGTIVGDYLAPSKKKPEVMWQKLGDGKWWFAGGSHYASMPDNTRNVIRWGGENEQLRPRC